MELQPGEAKYFVVKVAGGAERMTRDPFQKEKWDGPETAANWV